MDEYKSGSCSTLSIWNVGNNGQLVALRSTSRTKRRGCRCLGWWRKKVWKQQPMRACNGAIGSWDAGINVTETVASSVGWRRTLPLARLQTSCSEPLPNQFFDARPTEQPSIYVAYRKQWPQLICARPSQRHWKKSTCNNWGTFFFEDGPVSQSTNGRTENWKTQRFHTPYQRRYSAFQLRHRHIILFYWTITAIIIE